MGLFFILSLGLPIYYFSLRPYTEAQISITPIDDDSTISKNDDTTIPRKENGMVNFYNNIAFEADELTNEITQPKKKPAPPPPVKTEDKIEVLEIQQELKKLDEMLDEVDINLSNSERKLSIDGLSYVSDVVPCEESVVAVVHRDNVVTPAESIITPFFPKSSDMPATIVPSELLQNDDVLNDNNEDNNVDSPMPPDTPSPSGSDDDKTDFSLDEISPAPTPPPSLNDFPLLETKEMAPPPPLPPPLPSTENKNIEDFSPHKITSGYLNSVRLRPKKKEENKEEKTVFEPEDENLKVTSEKTKTFMKNLEGTLKRITLGIPSYIAVQPRENIIAELPENSNNENVIVDSINRNEAKEKFVSFVNSRLGNKNDNNEEKPKVKNKEMVGEQIAQTKDESKENESDDAFITHKNRMKNVFRSIHLPRMENSDKGVEDSSRNFKSLGHVNDDKTKHRQAMGQIFKNIELRGKDSQK
ncbi:hypothetical protein JTB14_008719 [Gonioctena quinquepunctata]|nr:hypothetical protein JTB14_008719 [Gonioctena quinquepunctata]